MVSRAQAGQYMPQGFDAETEFQIVRSGSSSTIIESKGFLKISGKYRQFAINVIGLDGTKTAELFS